ncbi:MAG TPA: NACHT domain-containing protein [Blastocatellia bacterium]|nr:NACHT domain-containing protein [Blastocatellia bacterium]
MLDIEKLRKLGLPLSQLILVGGIYLAYRYDLDWAKANRRFLLLMAVLYEVIVVIAIFVIKLWKKHFEDDALKATDKWLRALPGRYSPGFLRRYRQQVCFEHEIFNVRGLGLIAAHTLKLEHVFVDLKISTSSNPNQLNLDPVAAKQFADARSIWDFMRASKDRSGDAIALVVIGPPGCGKTTLLQYIAVTLALNRQQRYGVRAYTPVLLFLRNHIAAITANPSITLGELAEQHFSDPKRYPKLKPPRKWFDERLEDGKCLVLFDGLDEVAQASEREAVSRWVDEQLKHYPRSRFVITSRPQGYRGASLNRANIVEVRPFSGEQVARFIKNWYLANEIVSSGNKLDDGVRQRASKDADDLLERLNKPEARALRELTVNPLLLTMITMVHRYRGALPGSRVELYREICEVLFGRWRQSRGIQEKITADQKRTVLMPMAAKMMERNLREIEASAALEVIQKPLLRVGIKGDEVKTFLSDLQESSGLVQERDLDRWGFAHLTFQEYLTAAHWLAEKNTPKNWGQLVEESWWHETLRLYAAQGDATPILQACLDKNSVAALMLAAEIVEEGYREADEAVRLAVYERIGGALESPEEELRQLAAKVKLSLRLNRLMPLVPQSAVAIDTGCLSCAEYQLFLDEMRQQGNYYQPDHWNEYQFPSGQADQPVRGVRAEDAVAFCDWLTQRQGSGGRFRLPSPDEANQRPIKTKDMGVWCSDGESYNLTPLANEFEEDTRQRFSTLSNLEQPSTLSDLSSFPSRVRNLAHDLARDVARDLAFELALARSLELALARDVARDLALDLDGAHALARELDPGLTLDLSQVLTHSFIGARALARDIGLGLDLESAQASAFDIARNIARICGFARELPDSQRFFFGFLYYSELCLFRANMLGDLLRGVSASDKAKARHDLRENHAEFLKMLYTTFPETKNLRSRLRWLRPSRQHTNEVWTEENNRWILEAYWWLQTVMAREEGKLPAWEGIQIVREHVQSE